MTRFDRLVALVLTVAVAASSAAAAPCGNDESGFNTWVRDFRTVAAHKGISAATIRSAFQSATYNTMTIFLDRHQGQVRPPFKVFAAAAIPPRIKPAEAELEKHAAALQRIEKQFGVPKEILVAIWGLETDFGKAGGKAYTIGAVATLAYDCRRSNFFTAQLLDALRIIDRGDLSAKEMEGGLLGELGQTQFLPSSYYSFAVDFDGDGRADLLNSSEDALASTANYLRQHGWKAGDPWNAGTPNFDVLKIWNKSDVYAQVVGEFARQLLGAK
jgi:lytic murein transglycosylase